MRMLTSRRPLRRPNWTLPLMVAKEGVVAAEPDVHAGMDPGATLPHQDAAAVTA